MQRSVKLLLLTGVSVLLFFLNASDARQIPAGSRANARIDTVAVSENMSVIRGGRDRRLLLQEKRNRFDEKSGNYNRAPESSLRPFSPAVPERSAFSHCNAGVADVYVGGGGAAVRVEKDTFFAEYRALGTVPAVHTIAGNASRTDLWPETVVAIAAHETGVKESVLLKNGESPSVYRYRVRTNLPIHAEGETVRFGTQFISRISAFDAAYRPVPVSIQMNADTLTLSLDTEGVRFPVILDPSLELQFDASKGKDAFISEQYKSMNSGLCNYGMLCQESGIAKRFLVEFDTVSMGAIPSNASIMRAALVLTVENGPYTVSDSLVSVYRLTESWTEGASSGGNSEVNWNYRHPDTLWSTAGGTFDQSPYGTRPVGTVDEGDTLMFDVTGLVENWFSGQWANHGMLLKFDTENSGTRMFCVCSSDNATAADRPMLIVDYRIEAEIDSVWQTDSTWHSITAAWDTVLNDEAAFDSFAVFTLPDTVRISPYTPALSVATYDTLQLSTGYQVIVAGLKQDIVAYYSSMVTLHTSKQERRILDFGCTGRTGSSVTCSFDTLLMGLAPFDSFALFSAADSVTRYSDCFFTLTGQTHDTLTTKTLYRLLAGGYSGGAIDAYSAADSMETFINPVPAVAVIDTTDSTIVFYIPEDGNPDTTYYIVYDSTAGGYIDPSGGVSEANDSLRFKTLFDTVTVYVEVNTLHRIYVTAFDEDTLSAGAPCGTAVWSHPQVPGIDSIFANSPDSIFSADRSAGKSLRTRCLRCRIRFRAGSWIFLNGGCGLRAPRRTRSGRGERMRSGAAARGTVWRRIRRQHTCSACLHGTESGKSSI